MDTRINAFFLPTDPSIPLLNGVMEMKNKSMGGGLQKKVYGGGGDGEKKFHSASPLGSQME